MLAQSQRRTRSQKKAEDAVGHDEHQHTSEAAVAPKENHILAIQGNQRSKNQILPLPPKLTSRHTGLTYSEHKLLLLKREKLRAEDAQLRRFIAQARSQHLIEAAKATLVFGQEEAGTAVCISGDGLILTCSHCVADTEDEAIGKRMWLVAATDSIVQAQCTAWDDRRDLALMQITAAESAGIDGSRDLEWPFARISAAKPKNNTRIVCVGHPGSEDLETEERGVATCYDVLHVSEGAYLGLAAGQNVQDNSEIGALMHRCWTYWGHSGAPLIERSSGRLIGLHSSWDDQTGVRRGVGLEAIWAFLRDHGVVGSKSGFGQEARFDGGSGDRPIVLE